ncbi:hypothetical protein Tco_0541227 [Tanacetum coccineum]
MLLLLGVEDSAAPTTIEEITLAQTLIQIKAAKPKVVTTAATTTTTTTRPKAKGIVVHEPSSEVQESKEKKVEGSEKTAKSSRKKMLGRKRAGKEQQQESTKKQKVEKEKESDKVDEVDEAELKKILVIKKDEDVAIDTINTYFLQNYQ